MEAVDLKLARVERALREEPGAFDFYQVVRLLERMRPERSSVGGFGDPHNEVVRFRVHPSLAFPVSDIEKLDLSDGERAAMLVNFTGLVGPGGMLPLVYTAFAGELERNRNHALLEFLDLFHHRIISLFYRAWEKTRFPVRHEKYGSDPLEEHLLDLVGVGIESFRDKLDVPAHALAFHAGLLVLGERGAVALQQLLADFFAVPVEVLQFVGGWYRLPRRDQCALGEDMPGSTQLGLGAVAGDEIWDHQARVRIRVGPVSRAIYDQFLPGGAAYRMLGALTRFYSHDQFDFELQLVLARDEVPGFILGADAPQPLGWSTWIRSARFDRDGDETILTL